MSWLSRTALSCRNLPHSLCTMHALTIPAADMWIKRIPKIGWPESCVSVRCVLPGVCTCMGFEEEIVCVAYSERGPSSHCPPGRSLTRKSVPLHNFPKTARRHTMCWWWAVGSWRLATGGSWRLVAVGGGWRWLVVGDWWLMAVGSGWWLAVDGGWWLAVDGPLGWSLRAVLNKKKSRSLRPPMLLTNTASALGVPPMPAPAMLHIQSVGDNSARSFPAWSIPWLKRVQNSAQQTARIVGWLAY